MSNHNIEQALKYLKQGELNQVQHYLEAEKAEQDEYPPIVRFSLDDLSDEKYDTRGMTAEDARVIAAEMSDGISGDELDDLVATAMDACYPERILGDKYVINDDTYGFIMLGEDETPLVYDTIEEACEEIGHWFSQQDDTDSFTIGIDDGDGDFTPVETIYRKDNE